MDKKEAIFNAALKLFVEFGFHGTPTSRIAQEAGVANGTLFHYFSTKDELVVALFVNLKSRMSDYINENSKQEKALKSRLKAMYLSSLYWALDNKTEFRFIQQFHNSPFLAMIAPGEVEKQIKPHLDMLAKGIKEKIIKPLPVDFIYTLITSHMYGMNEYLTNKSFSKAKQHELINDSFELFWDMIS